MDRYIGLDVHATTTTMASSGRAGNLATLTLARRTAANVLTLRKKNEEYDPTKHRKQAA